MRVAPACESSLRLDRDPSHPSLGRRFRLGEPVRCAREGCDETFFFGVQSHVCPITAFCPEHQPAEVERGWPPARRVRGPSDGTSRDDDEPPPPGPRPYLAILSDDGARRIALMCRACGHIQSRAGAPECGCAARWVARVPGASVAQRFCVGCRRYHDLARFEDPDVPDHLRPRRACAWYRERLQLRVGSRGDHAAAPAPDPRDGDPSDDPSYPTDRFLAGAFSLFAAKFPARADDFAASEPRDAFADGLLGVHARHEPARRSTRAFAGAGRGARHGDVGGGGDGGDGGGGDGGGGDGGGGENGEGDRGGVRVRFIPANAAAAAAETPTLRSRTRRDGRTSASASARTPSARTPSAFAFEPLDASGARFGYLCASPDDDSPCVGTDTIDLPPSALARVDPRRAMERILFAGFAASETKTKTKSKTQTRARATPDDEPRTEPRTRARASAAAASASAGASVLVAKPSSFSSLATSAFEAGAPVLASVEGVLLEATRGRDGAPQLRPVTEAESSPSDAEAFEASPSSSLPPSLPPPLGLPPGALLNGSRAAVALVGGAGPRGCVARVVLRRVPGLDVDVRLRCRFAGHFLPVVAATQRGFLRDRTRTVVDIDASPPAPGFAPLEGAAFLETVAIRGVAAGLPVGQPVPVLLTTDPGARDEMKAAMTRAAEEPDSDAASRRVAWWLTCATTAATERTCSREFVRRGVEYAWRAGAYRTLDALLRAHAHLTDADANVARTCDAVTGAGAGSPGGFERLESREYPRARATSVSDTESPETIARTLASLDWSDADETDARSSRDGTLAGAFAGASASLPVSHVRRRSTGPSPGPGVESNPGFFEPGENGAARDPTSAENHERSPVGHAFDEHVRHRRERQRQRGLGRRDAPWIDGVAARDAASFLLRGVDTAGLFFLFSFYRVFDWRRASHWVKMLVDGCFWHARQVFWDRAAMRTRAAMREYRATRSAWSHALVMRRIVVLRLTHMFATSAQAVFGSFISPEWFDDRLASAYAFRSVMLGRERAGVAPETTPEVLRRWVLLLTVITVAKVMHNAKLVRAADLANFRVAPARGFSYQTVNHLIVVHLTFVMRFFCLHGPLGWLRAGADEWLARAWWVAFIVADSLVAAGVLVLIARRKGAGRTDRSLPFSFSYFMQDWEGTNDGAS